MRIEEFWAGLKPAVKTDVLDALTRAAKGCEAHAAQQRFFLSRAETKRSYQREIKRATEAATTVRRLHELLEGLDQAAEVPPPEAVVMPGKEYAASGHLELVPGVEP